MLVRARGRLARLAATGRQSQKNVRDAASKRAIYCHTRFVQEKKRLILSTHYNDMGYTNGANV